MTVAIAEEEDTLVFTRDTLVRLDPLTNAGRCPHAREEADGTTFGVGAIVAAHDGLDGFRGFVGVVERDGGDVVVQDVRLDDTVQQLSSDETELSVDGGGGSAHVVPASTGVMRKRGVSVLEVGDCDEPVVYPQVGNPVPDEEVGEAELLVEEEESTGGHCEANVGKEDEDAVLVFVERT